MERTSPAPTGIENKYYIDGADVTDPSAGVSGINLPYNFLREVEVRTGGYQAEIQSALGGIIKSVTPSEEETSSTDRRSAFSRTTSSMGRRADIRVNPPRELMRITMRVSA